MDSISIFPVNYHRKYLRGIFVVLLLVIKAVWLAGVLEMKPRNPKRDVFSVNFKVVFWIVLILTLISLFVSVFVAAWFTQPSTLQTSLFETCSTSWKIGFGAIVALIGVKATGNSNSS